MTERSEPESIAGIVERDDPRLYQTALFAPEPARSELLVLYAFDCGLSRAVEVSGESLIPRMRLRWWRDMIDGAARGDAPKAHDVARPLHRLIAGGSLAGQAERLHALIDAREAELSLPLTPETFSTWAHGRFQTVTDLAATILAGTSTGLPAVGEPMATAFALRTLSPMAQRQGRVVLPGLSGPQIARIARGDVDDVLSNIVRNAATRAQDQLTESRDTRASIPAAARPALLPLLWTDRTLRLASRPVFDIGQVNQVDRPFDGFRLLWRTLLGRW